MLLLNVLLAAVWVAVTGSVTMLNAALGFVLGYGMLWLAQDSGQDEPYFRKTGLVVGLVGFFLWELVLSTLRVAYDIVTPQSYLHPVVLAVPLRGRSAAEVSLVANLLTLTPGTLSLEISDDQRVLYVHVMYADDPEDARRSIEQGFVRRVEEVFS